MGKNETLLPNELDKQKIPPILCVHRGCRHEFNEQGQAITENTYEAFKRGIEAGANYVETDFRLTTDGQLVTSHGVEPHGYSLKEWTQKKHGSMTIEELATWAKSINEQNPDNKVGWLWEIKDTETDLFKVVDLIYQYGLEKNIKIISRHQGVIRDAMLAMYAKGIPQEIALVLLVPEASALTSNEIINRAKATDIETENGATKYQTDVAPLFPNIFRKSQRFQEKIFKIADIMTVARERGKRIIADAVHGDTSNPSSERILRAMANEGVEAVNVDHPKMLQKIFGVSPRNGDLPPGPDVNLRSVSSDVLVNSYRKSDNVRLIQPPNLTEEHAKFFELSKRFGLSVDGVSNRVLRTGERVLRKVKGK